jgi:hypothetical protein
VTDVTGAERPKTPAALGLSALWLSIKQLLVQQGTSKSTKEAGVLVGAAAKKYGQDVFVVACRATLDAKPADAHTYLIGLCEKAVGNRPMLNKQMALEQSNQRVADNWVPPELRTGIGDDLAAGNRRILNKQEALEQRNRRAVESWVPSEMRTGTGDRWSAGPRFLNKQEALEMRNREIAQKWALSGTNSQQEDAVDTN